MASRNFLGIRFLAAMSPTKASCPGGSPARCTSALIPYLPFLVSMRRDTSDRRGHAPPRGGPAPTHSAYRRATTNTTAIALFFGFRRHRRRGPPPRRRGGECRRASPALLVPSVRVRMAEEMLGQRAGIGERLPAALAA